MCVCVGVGEGGCVCVCVWEWVEGVCVCVSGWRVCVCMCIRGIGMHSLLPLSCVIEGHSMSIGCHGYQTRLNRVDGNTLNRQSDVTQGHITMHYRNRHTHRAASDTETKKCVCVCVCLGGHNHQLTNQ